VTQVKYPDGSSHTTIETDARSVTVYDDGSITGTSVQMKGLGPGYSRYEMRHNRDIGEIVTETPEWRKTEQYNGDVVVEDKENGTTKVTPFVPPPDWKEQGRDPKGLNWIEQECCNRSTL
jgi:hypothetical protein